MDVVAGVTALRAATGPLFAVVGVFDGIHVGHAYLLEHLVREAARRDSRAAVITFDSHPDEVLVGAAPPLLVDPADRLSLLADAGVEVTVVQHFDAELRATRYDTFIEAITARCRLTGLLMTPDAAFGFERRGTPAALAELGARSEPPFEVVVVPPITAFGEPVSSSGIRRAVAAGELAAAARLLGRPYAVVGDAAPDGTTVRFPLPVALPPPGEYGVTIGSQPARATIGDDGDVRVAGGPADAGRVRIVFDERG